MFFGLLLFGCLFLAVLVVLRLKFCLLFLSFYLWLSQACISLEALGDRKLQEVTFFCCQHLCQTSLKFEGQSYPKTRRIPKCFMFNLKSLVYLLNGILIWRDLNNAALRSDLTFVDQWKSASVMSSAFFCPSLLQVFISHLHLTNPSHNLWDPRFPVELLSPLPFNSLSVL